MPPWQFPNDPDTLARLKMSIRRHLRGIIQLRDYLDSDDILQNVLLRLMAAAEAAKPQTQADLLGLAARHIRWELIDLHRAYFGPEGPGRKVVALSGVDVELPIPTGDPRAAIAIAEAVERLPDDLRQVVDLLFYNELTHDDAAKLLDVTGKTVSRRWREARVQLARLLA